MNHINSGVHRFQAGVGDQEVALSLQENEGIKMLTLATGNYRGDACFMDLPLAIARALRDWLNAQDLAE